MCVRGQLSPTFCEPMDCSPPGFSVHGIIQEEYWSGLPFPCPGGLPDPGVEPTSPASPALAGRFFTSEPPGKPKINKYWGYTYLYLLIYIYIYYLYYNILIPSKGSK